MNPLRKLVAGTQPWTRELGSKTAFGDYHIYSYEWIDRLSGFEDAEEFLSGWALKDAFLNQMRDRFKSAGWQGDGQFQILWLPPFTAKDAPTTGYYILHVKQSDDGISWIASRYQIYGLEKSG